MAVVVDHWPMVRIGISRVLSTIDIRVVGEARIGLEGIRLAESTGADLLVLGDHVGVRASEAVRRAKELPDAPRVIALLGQVGRDELVSLLEAGADGLLVRAVGPDELAAAVARLWDGERVVSPALLPALVGMVDGAGNGAGEDGAGALSGLTTREREVLVGLAQGRTNQQIAANLFVAPTTVKTHLSHIYDKLGVKSRHEALARAVALGLLD
jgi:DNA-binding NarL/FixJ family response regulator